MANSIENDKKREIFFVYIIKCIDRQNKVSLYTGYTNNLMRRVEEHSSGKGARYTRGKKLELVYFETSLSQSDAMRREQEIKRLPKEKKWALIKSFNVMNENNSGNEN